jgi:hypothetical protein
MKIADSFGKLMAARWLPFTSAVVICFGAAFFFEHRYETLLMKARMTLNDFQKKPNEPGEKEEDASAVEESIEAHDYEHISGHSSTADSGDEMEEECIAQDELIEAELAYRDLWTEMAEQDLFEAYALGRSDVEGQEPIVNEQKTPVQPVEGRPAPTISYAQGSPIPSEFATAPPRGEHVTHRSTHTSFAPLAPRSTLNHTPRARGRPTLTNIITTALFKGSSITINPPSSTASPSNSSPIIFPRTPFPFGSTQPSHAPSFLGSPGPFSWATPSVPKRVKRKSMSSSQNSDIVSARPNTGQRPLPQMPTIVEESRAALGTGTPDAPGDATAELRNTLKRKRRQERRGLRKGSTEY